MEPAERSLQNNLNSLSSQMRNVVSQMRQMTVKVKSEQDHIEKNGDCCTQAERRTGRSQEKIW